MHAQEQFKTSNTGRLAAQVLPNSEIRYRGLPDRTPLNLDGLVDNEYETWMLHLSEESEELTPGLVNALIKPVRLLVPDGTWSQASRTGSKLAKEVPARHVFLRATKPSRYLLRTEHLSDGMATFEAIARALGFLEGPAIQADMERIFRIMVDRVLLTRGRQAMSRENE